MISRLLLPLLAVIGLGLGIITVILDRREPPTPPIPFPPPIPHFEHFVAAEGLVEAASEDVFIGTPFTEVVKHVFVNAGDFAEKGAPLFELETISLEAQLGETIQVYETAKAEYTKSLALPRAEDIPPMVSMVRQAEATYVDHLKQFELAETLANPKAISRDEYNQRKYGALLAKFELIEAQENLNKLLAGTWIRDLEIIRNEMKEAKAAIRVVQESINRSVIRAPFSGHVLRVNIRIGESAPVGELDTPLMIFGIIDPLHIRVDVDEEDVWRVTPGMPATAYVRGNSNIFVNLEFIRLEPFLIPKVSLTGANTEQTDTRVLQVIYSFDRDDRPIYPGEVMDVYIEAKPSLGVS